MIFTPSTPSPKHSTHANYPGIQSVQDTLKPSAERQNGSTTSNIYIHLDPFPSKLRNCGPRNTERRGNHQSTENFYQANPLHKQTVHWGNDFGQIALPP